MQLNNFIANGVAEKPPKWWLKQLYYFDDKLVVIPSSQRPATYILARRPEVSRGLDPIVKWMRNTNQDIPADTLLCANHGVVPVCLMYKTGATWSIENVIADLASRDIRRQGGAEVVADKLDKQDVDAENLQRQTTFQNLYHRGRDGWRSYTARTGQRVNPGGTAAQAARRDKGGGSEQP